MQTHSDKLEKRDLSQRDLPVGEVSFSLTRNVGVRSLVRDKIQHDVMLQKRL